MVLRANWCSSLMNVGGGNVATPITILGAAGLAWFNPSGLAPLVGVGGSNSFGSLDITTSPTIAALVNLISPGTGDLSQPVKARQPTYNTSLLGGYGGYQSTVATGAPAGQRMFSNAISPASASGSIYVAGVIRVDSYNNNFTVWNVIKDGSNWWSASPNNGATFCQGVSASSELNSAFGGGIGGYANNSFTTGTFRTWEAVITPGGGGTGTIVTRVNGASQVTATQTTPNWVCDRIVIGSEANDTSVFALLSSWPEVVFAQGPSAAQQTAIQNYFRSKYAHY